MLFARLLALSLPESRSFLRSLWEYTALYMMVAISYIIVFTMFKYEMFDLKPSAHLAAFEITTSPIIILDDKFEVVSWNNAAQNFSGNRNAIHYHMKMEKLFVNKELINAIIDTATFSFKSGSKHYVLEPIALKTISGHNKGYLLKFNEITGYMEKIEKLDYQASHNELTKILNRRAFHERVQHFLEDKETKGVSFSMIMIDLDDFKNVNDSYGHAIGDQVLTEMVSLINTVLPEKNLFSRYGGEEFLIMLPSCDAKTAGSISESIRIIVLNNDFVYGDIRIRIQISLGVYNYQQGDTGDVYDFIKYADEALYLSKRTGKNKVSTFTKSPKKT